MALKSGPFFSYRNVHYFFELLNAFIWMRKIFDPVFVSELFVSLLCVQNNSFHFVICSVFSKLFNFLLFKFLCFLNLLSIFLVIYSYTCPFIPALFDIWYFYLISKLFIYFCIFLFFELVNHLIFIFRHK